MAKSLKDILKNASDTIKGVRTSVTGPLSIGKDPGVDYEPKAGDEQDFVAKHSLQRWDDVAGNPDFSTKVKEAPFKKQTKGVYESKKAEDIKCNHTPGQTWCPIHEMANCTDSKPRTAGRSMAFAKQTGVGAKILATKEEVEVNEISKSTLQSYIDKSGADTEKQHANVIKGRTAKIGSPEAEAGYRSMDKLTNRKIGMRRAERKLDEIDNSPIPYDPNKRDTSPITNQPGDNRPIPYDPNKRDTSPITNQPGDNRPIPISNGVPRPVPKTAMTGEKDSNPFSRSGAQSGTNSNPFSRTESQSNTRAGQNINPSDSNKQYDPRNDQDYNSNKHYDPKNSKPVNEVITKKTPPGQVITDFQKSTNPKFAGKSPEKRKQMALAAYYAKQREKKTVKEDLAVPLLGGDVPRGYSDDAIDMVKSELNALANKAAHLVTQMPSGMHVEPWCQSKIAQAKLLINDVHDYMVYGEHGSEDDEQMDTAMTFPNMSVDVNTGQNV